jgi:hypothetical protein
MVVSNGRGGCCLLGQYRRFAAAAGAEQQGTGMQCVFAILWIARARFECAVDRLADGS